MLGEAVALGDALDAIDTSAPRECVAVCTTVLMRELGGLCELCERWVVYAHFQCTPSDYSTSYVALGSFDSIGSFWGAFNALPNVKLLCQGRVGLGGKSVSAYSIFRSDIRPEWEDARNQFGGEWGCRESIDPSAIEAVWRVLAVACVNEEIPGVTGMRIINKTNRMRTLHKIEVWIDEISHLKATACLREVQAVLSTVLHYSSMPRFVFSIHRTRQEHTSKDGARRAVGRRGS